jgi:hypothetical protein
LHQWPDLSTNIPKKLTFLQVKFVFENKKRLIFLVFGSEGDIFADIGAKTHKACLKGSAKNPFPKKSFSQNRVSQKSY